MPILQDRLPFAPWTDAHSRRLPGTRPAGADDWVRVDEAYSAQMALRDELLSKRHDEVVAAMPEAEAAVLELLDLGLVTLSHRVDFNVRSGSVNCPDGRSMEIDRNAPFDTLGRLLQEDLCVLQKPDGALEHVLTGAVLCFPASWTLSEKLGRPLSRVHRPVPEYSPVATRAQRLFDGLRPGRPIWRANAHFHDDPFLFTPRREDEPRQLGVERRYVRSEYQVLFRLPHSNAIAFSIHTYMVKREALSASQKALLEDYPPPVGG